MPNAWDVGLGAAARVARVRGARDDEQRLRGDARPARLRGDARGGDRARGGARRRRSRCRCRPTSRTASPTIPRASPRRSGSRSTRARGRLGRGLHRDARRADLPVELAAERVAAAAAAAHAGPVQFVLTARCENFLHGRADLADTIARLQAYAGRRRGRAVRARAYATRGRASARWSAAVDKPVNVLVGRGAPPVSELASLGVARVSVGGAFAFAALGALVEAASELRDAGTYGYAERVVVGARAAREAFDGSSSGLSAPAANICSWRMLVRRSFTRTSTRSTRRSSSATIRGCAAGR